MNSFETEVSKSAQVIGIHYEKMPIPTKLGMSGGKPFLIKLKENPYDGFLVFEGKHIPLELKSQMEFGSFPLSNIRDHQVVGLKHMIELGCDAYLLINQRRVLKDGKQVSANRAWALDMCRWDELLSQIGNRKSIPVEFFESKNSLLVEIPRMSSDNGRVWDLRYLL